MSAHSRRGGRRQARTAGPLPDRGGVSATRLRMPVDGQWRTVGEFLLEYTHAAEGVWRRLEAGEVLLGDGTVVRSDTSYQPGEAVYLYRDLPDETVVPGALTVLYQDADIVVVDKPHFLATMPRGRHVVQTALVQLRRKLDLPELTPAHRLDRLTAGVLLLTVRPEVRAAYQGIFAKRQAKKTYLALAPIRSDLELPVVLCSRIVKPREGLQAIEVPGAVNAITRVELVRRVSPRLSLGAQIAGTGTAAASDPEHGAGAVIGKYRLTPETGRTHQLRVHLASLGIPIIGDPLYPTVRADAAEDFSRPMQLLAQQLEFTDPITGEQRRFTSHRVLVGRADEMTAG